jgi:glycosyltransferase involved in cell wall biosynthesis
MRKDQLLLFTTSFPYGSGEQFIETEVLYLSKAFDKVFIYPLILDKNPPRSLPENVSVVKLQMFNPHNRIATLIQNMGTVLKIFLFQALFSRHRLKYIFRFKYFLNNLLNKLNDASIILKEVNRYDTERTVFYSYWFNAWTETIMLAKEKVKSIKFITRIHGGDYDELRRTDGLFQFREYFYSKKMNIASISSYGVNFLNQRYNHHAHVTLCRLGVMDQGRNPFNYNIEKVIVSCSSMIDIKRVDLLIDVLSEVKTPLKWIHFGDGPLEDKIKNYAQSKFEKAKVDYEFKGHQSNSDIMNFYRNNPVDVFVSTSSIEGIPVSMMEAISFGIPIIGCNVGGVPEIVTSETGFLFPREFSPLAVAKELDNYFNNGEEAMIKLRNSAYAFWKQNFNADVNFNSFINHLYSIR